MKYLLVIYCTLKLIYVSAQEPIPKLANTIWQNKTENYIYSVYYNNKVYKIFDLTDPQRPELGIEVLVENYGFYDSRELMNLDSLKSTGDYYYELDSTDFEDERQREISVNNKCGELHIFTSGKDTLMNIYYSYRQQYVTFKKMEALPHNIQAYLKKEGIKIINK